MTVLFNMWLEGCVDILHSLKHLPALISMVRDLAIITALVVFVRAK